MKKIVLGVLLALIGFRLSMYSISEANIVSYGTSWTTGLPIKGMDTLLVIGILLTAAGIAICAIEAYRKDT